MALFAAACVAVDAAGQGEHQPSDFSVSASYVAISEAGFDGAHSGRSASVRETQLAVVFPMVNGRNSVLTAGIDYQYSRFEYDGIAGRDRDLHRLLLPLRWHYRGRGWITNAEVAAGLSTSSNVFNTFWKDATSDDTILTASIETTFPRRTEGPRWLLGVSYDRTFGESRLYPSFGTIFSPSAPMSIRLAFPDSAVRYATSERQHWTLRLFPSGHKWHVVSDELGTNFDYRAEAMRVEGTWRKKTRASIWVEVTLGYEFERRHRWTDDTGQVIDANLGSNSLVQIRFRKGEAVDQVSRLLNSHSTRQRAGNNAE
ncbi:MAG: hypothetical protein HKN70_03330 [Gammaproteobacteria bacterium]|nr:hypothetical protein [Gammaproteobacteria bacterium]